MKIIDPVDWSHWNSLYSAAYERTFFTSPVWARGFAQVYGGHPLLMEFECGAVMPAFVVRRMRGVLLGLRSMPPSNYGALLAHRTLNADDYDSIVREISRCWQIHTVVVSGVHPPAGCGWERQVGSTSHTHLLRLNTGYEAVCRDSYDAKQRNQIRKAQKSGVEVRVERSAAGVESFYRLYLLSCQRWMNKPEPKAFFEWIVLHGDPHVKLWIASRNGVDIAGIIVTDNGKDTAYYVYGASDHNEWAYCPNNLLLDRAISAACEQGLFVFDMLPSGRIESVARFKESFGAQKEEVLSYWLKGRIPSFRKPSRRERNFENA